MSDGALLDLVCGPASPLPETYQRYRLVAHLGSGGQAEVYRAVRLCGGVSSAPMTVKVFRVDPCRPLVDELRSWDKGDAALMDLNNRGVPGICRRADGFYGPPPHRSGEPPSPGDAVPYQIYDYFHGVNLREYVDRRVGRDPGAVRLNAVGALRMLAGVLGSLHDPRDHGATPVLHMDVKPANVMVLTNGDIRLIDFTGARYWRDGEITQISYTRESGGPEAFGGARQLSPAYDVHGFGAVAFHLIAGVSARVDSDPSMQQGDRPMIRRLPALDRFPALRDHLYASLADRPGDRPTTAELGAWTTQLGELVRRAGPPDLGVDWTEPDRAETARAIGRATPVRVVNGTETGAFERIERLERELVELRGNEPPGSDPWGGEPRGSEPHGGEPRVHEPHGNEPDEAPVLRGRAKVPTRKPAIVDETSLGPMRVDAPDPWRAPRRTDWRTLKRGWELTGLGGLLAFVCWGIWAVSSGGKMVSPLIAFMIVPCVALGVFSLSRMVGRLLLEQRLGRTRRSARGAHAVTGLFLAVVGIAYLQQTPWVVDFETWVKSQLL
ncbi:MAG: hypothetical protein HKP61_16195 [Dactylosporangium sp.]|nr:hypothetical protein [Dactylosporangium sp.]NNJ62447.1 hypothetical protein [Dactylosporangium sp.]